MDWLRTLTYWFVGINVVVSTLFIMLALVLGGRDLYVLLRALEHAVIDDTDDGRAQQEP